VTKNVSDCKSQYDAVSVGSLFADEIRWQDVDLLADSDTCRQRRDLSATQRFVGNAETETKSIIRACF
jgi:hypothetical protein